MLSSIFPVDVLHDTFNINRACAQICYMNKTPVINLGEVRLTKAVECSRNSLKNREDRVSSKSHFERRAIGEGVNYREEVLIEF